MNAINSSTRLYCTISKLLGKPLNGLFGEEDEMKHKKSKHSLDEMQDHNLLKIEELGFWLSFWVSFAVIVIQVLAGASLKEIAGEIIILFVASIYIACSTVKSGLWTRNYVPTLKTNAITSIIPSLAIGILNFIRAFFILKTEIRLVLVRQIFVIMLAVYVVCFVILEVLRLVYKKRHDKLEDIDDDNGR